MILSATGHRPDKLGGYSSETRARLRRLATWFFEANRPDFVISGMALGWDMAWAEAAIEMHIPVVAAVPFSGQESTWPLASRDRYQQILSQCQRVEIICPGPYGSWKMQERNQWMVDNSDMVIALWDGSDGGTANCVQYAERLNRQIHNLWPYWSAGVF